MLLGFISNNVGQQAYVSFQLAGCPWDCAVPANGRVDTQDFLALLGQWGQFFTSCNIVGPPAVVDAQDFLDLLGHWGPCP